ncbi:MAG: DUF1778 domain-containing protein [Nanoarchaeota archaeon]|nr:DUF1778 domain-containing protein [Nanoarchaeota archaeon]
MVKISLEIKEEALKIIDKARELDYRTRTSFLVSSALKEANKKLNSQ